VRALSHCLSSLVFVPIFGYLVLGLDLVIVLKKVLLVALFCVDGVRDLGRMLGNERL
jgi:hypothetical protein